MEEPSFLDDDFDAEIDLTPLIDVVFMLLLFFILAATFSTPVLQVTLPEAGTARQVENDPARLVLAIDAEGRLHYRDGKSRYIADLPRFIGYLDAVLPRHPTLVPLAQLFADTLKPALAARGAVP